MSAQEQCRMEQARVERGVSGSSYHDPVLVDACVSALLGSSGSRSGVYADLTLGGGGHSRALLTALGPQGRLLCFDMDADALSNAPDDGRVLLIESNYRHLGRWLDYVGYGRVDGVLVDLGVSLHQVTHGPRGFSYDQDGPLDMRMAQQSGYEGLTAGEWLRMCTVDQLGGVLRSYGEVPRPVALAQRILEYRDRKGLESTGDLRAAVLSIGVQGPRAVKLLSCVFQALRILVNDELSSLSVLLGQLGDRVNPGGRVAFLTYHSLEDRLVKRFLRQGIVDRIDPCGSSGSSGSRSEAPLGTGFLYGESGEGSGSCFRELTRRPVEPGSAECACNPRARSARLRVGERL